MSQVRVSPNTHELLRTLASEAGKPMQEIIDRAVEEYRRSSFLRGLNEDFQALQRDRKEWNSYQEERSEWESTVADGLDDENQAR
ncbi:MAG: toxin-antitoxin system protein [Pyrinomonadaceae bacterium]